MEFLNFNFYILAISFSVSLLSSYLIILFWPKFTSLGVDNQYGVQKTHTEKALRLGGLAIYLLLIFFCFFVVQFDWKISILLLSIFPLLIFALLEDLTNKISPSIRLFSTLITASLIILLTGSKLEEVDILWIDNLLTISTVSISFTIIGLTATANAFNFIDGLNGLSSGLSLVVLSILAYFSLKEGNLEIFNFIILLMSIISGFFVINIITGKIFLGDTGAYILGIIIAWIGVEITSKDSNISSWAIFFIILYPAIELLFSVFRRISSGKSPFNPDHSHLHSMVFKFVKNNMENKDNRFSNTFSGFITLIFASIPSIIVILFNPTYPLVIHFILIYITLYFLLFYLMKYLKNDY